MTHALRFLWSLGALLWVLAVFYAVWLGSP